MSKRISWKDVCPNCVKYDYPDQSPNCEHCLENGVTGGVLCDLNRMNREGDDADFQCDAFVPKQGVQ